MSDALTVDIVERKLSDKSKVFSVRIREQGGLPFIELDAHGEHAAYMLRSSILVAIQNYTNINLKFER